MIAIRETPPSQPAASAAPSQFVVFTLVNEAYALPVAQVREILRWQPVKRVPQAPAFVEGILNLRGRVIAVVDLRRRFDLPATECTNASRVIVVRARGIFVGLIVDQVREVANLTTQSIQPVPVASTTQASGRFLAGVARRGEQLLMLLNLDELFSLTETDQCAAATK